MDQPKGFHREEARQRLSARQARQRQLQKDGLNRTFPGQPIIGLRLVIIILVLLALCAFLYSRFSKDVDISDQQEVTAESGTATEGEWSGGDAPDEPESTPDYAVLTDALQSGDLASEMIEKASRDEDLYWIATHPEAYAVDGDSVQRKLLKLAIQEPEAISFVRAWPDSYPSDKGEPSDVSEQSNGIPRMYQWDMRWGYTVYSSTTFALTGCCPTVLSMVYQGLTGNNDLTPYDMGVLADEGGYMTKYNGTDARFLVDEAPALGLSCYEIPADEERLKSALEEGAVAIANVGPGEFTEGGHFIVVTGIDEEGRLAVNDPYSAVRSSKTWDIDLVLGQTYSLFVFRLA